MTSSRPVIGQPPPPRPRLVFKASTLWADAFYKSKCPCVCVSVGAPVRVFTFEVLFKRLFAPTYQSWKFLEIRNPLGKVVERSDLGFEIFCSKMV